MLHGIKLTLHFNLKRSIVYCIIDFCLDSSDLFDNDEIILRENEITNI